MSTLAIIGNPRKRRKPKAKAARRVAKTRRKNPVATKRKSRTTPIRQRRYSAVKRKGIRRVRRTNPIGLKGLGKMLMPAGIGAASAVVIHEIYSKLAAKFSGSVPVALQSGYGQLAAEAGLVFVLNMVMEKTKLIKDAQTRQHVVMGALTGLGIKAIQQSGVMSKIGGASTAGYQMIDVSSLNGYQMAAAPSSSLGYMNTSPTVGTISNIRNFRRSRTG